MNGDKNIKNLASSTLGDDNVTDPNQIIDKTNTQPDYYTATLNRDLNTDEELSTTAVNGLDDITSEGVGDVEDYSLKEPLDLDEDGLNTTTDTAHFTDLGGMTRRGESFSQDTASGLPAGTAGHPGVDEDTD